MHNFCACFWRSLLTYKHHLEPRQICDPVQSLYYIFVSQTGFHQAQLFDQDRQFFSYSKIDMSYSKNKLVLSCVKFSDELKCHITAQCVVELSTHYFNYFFTCPFLTMQSAIISLKNVEKRLMLFLLSLSGGSSSSSSEVIHTSLVTCLQVQLYWVKEQARRMNLRRLSLEFHNIVPYRLFSQLSLSNLIVISLYKALCQSVGQWVSVSSFASLSLGDEHFLYAGWGNSFFIRRGGTNILTQRVG